MRDTARLLLSRSRLLQDYKELREHCDHVSFSAKTNYEVADVLREDTECGFSVHSIKGLARVGAPTRSLYFTQASDEEELIEVLDSGCTAFVVDNEVDLETLLGLVRRREQAITLALRMRLKEHTIHTGKYYVYGLAAQRVRELLVVLSEDNHVARLGVHVHRKSQNLSEWDLLDEIRMQLGDAIEHVDDLNMGGGLPVVYKNFSHDPSRRIHAEMDRLREWLHAHDATLTCEPGRVLAAPCIELHARVKLVHEGSIVINCSVYNAAMDTFVTSHKLRVRDELQSGETYTIKGCTPCSMDMFRYRVYLDDPKPGDALVFENAGAYTYATDFCGLEKLPVEVVE